MAGVKIINFDILESSAAIGFAILESEIDFKIERAIWRENQVKIYEEGGVEPLVVLTPVPAGLSKEKKTILMVVNEESEIQIEIDVLVESVEST